MSVKHVKDYYIKVANDYHQMKLTLDELEKCVSEDTASALVKNIDVIRQQVNTLKENYMRIAYIVFLLNQPNKKEKQKRYRQQQQKMLKNIPEKDTYEGVLKENQSILRMLKNLEN